MVAFVFKNGFIFRGQKFHSVAQAEWGATFQVGTEDLSEKGMGIVTTAFAAGFVLAGDYRALITGCGPGPSL